MEHFGMCCSSSETAAGQCDGAQVLRATKAVPIGQPLLQHNARHAKALPALCQHSVAELRPSRPASRAKTKAMKRGASS